MRYLYRPKGDRTPVHDPVLGHLSYDGVYEDPRCADDPRFIEEKAEKAQEPETPVDTAAEHGEPEAEQAPPKRAKSAGS